MATTTYDAALLQPPTNVSTRPVARFYAPELDVLRLGAFLLVFCRHVATSLGDARRSGSTSAAGITPGSLRDVAGAASSAHWSFLQESLQSLDFGVCLFFFLSSFLITRLLLLERGETGTVAVRSFYLRRLLRIWPLYFAFLAAVVLLTHWFPLLQTTPSRLLAACLFVANWAAVLHGWQSIAIQPLWSVSVEEQFYAVWPWLARLGRTAIIRLSVGMMLLALGTLWFLGRQTGLEVTATWPNTLVQGLFLAGGALAACCSSPENNRFRDSTRVLLIGAGFCAWLMASAGCHVVRTVAPGAANLVAGYLLVLLGTGLIFYGVAGWNRHALPRTLIVLGRMSYGLYVFHVAVLLALYSMTARLPQTWQAALSPYARVLGVSGVGLLLTTALAALSYRYLETPFLKLKSRFAVVASRPV